MNSEISCRFHSCNAFSWQYLAVLVVTFGLAFATHRPASSDLAASSGSSEMMTGALFMGCALVLKAAGGAIQERALNTYGASTEVINEALFWQSLLVPTQWFITMAGTLNLGWFRRCQSLL